MECQREPGPTRVRLTDQALVAVTVARQAARAEGRAPTSADLLIGLAAEPEGWAGHLLRRRAGALAALADRTRSLPPQLAHLEQVVVSAWERSAPRPPGTADLLSAVVSDGGEDIEDLLTACGFSYGDLRLDAEDPMAAPSDWIAGDDVWHAGRETVTLTAEAEALDPDARRAIGQIRAVGGGAVELLVLIAAAHGPIASHGVALDAPALNTARRELAPVADSPPSWDSGLDAVLEAAAVLAGDGRISPGHLLQAALLAGGSGPSAVIERARASAPKEDE